jgi:hypothetical protein
VGIVGYWLLAGFSSSIQIANPPVGSDPVEAVPSARFVI